LAKDLVVRLTFKGLHFLGNPPHQYLGVLSDYITRSCFGVHSCVEQSCRIGIGTDHSISEAIPKPDPVSGKWDNSRLQLHDHELYQLDRYQLTEIDEIMKAVYNTEQVIKQKIPEFESLVVQGGQQIKSEIEKENSKIKMADIINEYLNEKYKTKMEEKIERAKTVTILDDYIYSEASA